MAKSKYFLLLLISVLLLFKIFTFTQQSNLPRVIILNVAFLSSKRHHDDVFPAMGFSYTQRPDGGRKLLPPVFNGNDIVVLGQKNFSNFMAKNHHVAVIFYRWRAGAEHAALAKKLTGASVVAKVDIGEEHKLADKYKIVRYPIVYFFPGGAELGDEYYNEWTPELDSPKRVEGKFIGKMVSRSDEDAGGSDKNGQISTLSSTGYRQSILEVAEPRKIENRKLIHAEDAKAGWYCEQYPKKETTLKAE